MERNNERNKTLIIILSVTLFLGLVASAGAWFFYPRGDEADYASAPENADASGGDPIEWVRRNDFPALTAPEPESEQEIIVYGEDTEKKDAAPVTPADSAPEPRKVAPYQPAPVVPRVPALPPPPPAVVRPPAPLPPPVAKAPEPVKRPAPKAAPVQSPVPAPAPAAPSAPATAPAPRKPERKSVTVPEYSIQVGAFATRDRAEELNQMLKEKGLAGRIFYADGPNLYRLRIGPYDNKAEAEKFLSWVRGIRGFEKSLIYER